MSEKVFSKALTKKQVCQLLDISPATLANWLNEKYFDQITQLGYTKDIKILTPRILNFLSEKIDLQPENKSFNAKS